MLQDDMSALEVIEQIIALPPAERRKVADFVRKLEKETEASTGRARVEETPFGIRYASQETFEKSMAKVFAEHEELFRRLAQ
jgi:hypothetical protein